MKRVAWLLPVLVGLAGCQSSDAPSTGAEPSETSQQVATSVPPPSTEGPTDIALVHNGQFLKVGATGDEGMRIFRDPKQAGFEFSDLPPHFKGPYRARTWEATHEGFGEILYDGTVVSGMHQEDRADQERVARVVSTYQEQLGTAPQMVLGQRVNYWFWEKEKQRLMICAYQTEKEGIKITVAMGDDVVMDALGISPKKAEKDRGQIDAAFAKKAGALTSPKQ